jgi:trigger factor
LDVKVIPAEKWRRYIEVTMPPEELEPRVTEALQDYRKRIQIDGFRKGKAPLQLVKQIYGDAVREKTIEDLVPKILSDARDQHSLKTIGPAQLENVAYDKKDGLKVRAYVEVMPEVELRPYTNLEFERVVYEIGDHDVAETLEDLREQFAKLEKVEGEAQPGHFVLADLQRVDATGVPIIGTKYEDRQIHIDLPGSAGETFTKPLVGARVGDTRRVNFPERRQEGSGEDIPTFYDVLIKEISEKKLPELDDEFAHEVGRAFPQSKIATIADLRKAIRDDLSHRAARRSEEALDHEMIDELLKMNPFELPEGLTESYVKSLTEHAQSQLKNVPEETLKNEARAVAVRRLRWQIVREYIAQMEGIEVSDEEVREYIVALALSSNQDPQRLINQTMHDEEKRERVREDLHEGKVLQHLKKQVKIRERRVPFGRRDEQRIITV